jgi:hypothetical protein
MYEEEYALLLSEYDAYDYYTPLEVGAPSHTPVETTDADTAYLAFTATLDETHITTDAGETYLKFTVTGHERQRPFLFVFRYAPIAYWAAPNPHSPWTTVASNPWALGTIKVGSPQ